MYRNSICTIWKLFRVLHPELVIWVSFSNQSCDQEWLYIMIWEWYKRTQWLYMLHSFILLFFLWPEGKTRQNDSWEIIHDQLFSFCDNRISIIYYSMCIISVIINPTKRRLTNFEYFFINDNYTELHTFGGGADLAFLEEFDYSPDRLTGKYDVRYQCLSAKFGLFLPWKFIEVIPDYLVVFQAYLFFIQVLLRYLVLLLYFNVFWL